MTGKQRIPGLRKNGKYAYLTWQGQRHYLGTHGTPEAERAYREWIADWSKNGFSIPIPEANEEELTIGVLCIQFWRYAKQYYTDERSSGTLKTYGRVIQELNTMYGDLPAKEFGPKRFKTMRECWIQGTHAKKRRPLSRKTINKYSGMVKAIIKYGVAEELLPPSCYQALQAVDGLRLGRSRARDDRHVEPVPAKSIDKTLPHLPKALQAVVNLQLYTGARPSEILMLRVCDIDRSGEVWTAKLKTHKTQHKGKARTLYFGPQAQSVLTPFLFRSKSEYLFKPIEALRERWAACEGHRRPDQLPNPRKSDRTLGEHYTRDSYRNAIKKACKNAGVKPWTPYQLRHNAATYIRKNYGLEAAQVILGHATANVTEVYAERDTSKALDVISKIG